MNKCLVTTLKASTNNEALSKYNVLTIKTKVSDSPTINTQWIRISASENGSVSINSPSVGLYQSGISGALLSYPLTVQANTSVESHFENKDGIIEVTGKYNLSAIVVGTNGTLRMKEIYGIPATIIDRLIISNIEEGEIDINKLSNSINRSKIRIIRLPTGNVNFVNKFSKNAIKEFISIEEINISVALMFNELGLDDIANNVNINNISTGILKGGNLASLAKLTALTNIMFSDTNQNNGDIMDFINPWIQAGRTSGKIKVSWIKGQKNITLNGQPITYPSEVPNVNAYLNWTSDGTVTFTAS